MYCAPGIYQVTSVSSFYGCDINFNFTLLYPLKMHTLEILSQLLLAQITRHFRMHFCTFTSANYTWLLHFRTSVFLCDSILDLYQNVVLSSCMSIHMNQVDNLVSTLFVGKALLYEPYVYYRPTLFHWPTTCRKLAFFCTHFCLIFLLRHFYIKIMIDWLI